MKKILLICLVICHLAAKSQNVGIGTTSPNPSAVLDVSSTNKGVLLPRMTTAQRNAIVSPATGLTIFNIDDQCTDIFDGAYWIKNCGWKQGDSLQMPGNDWVPKTDFGGTARRSAVGFSIGNKGYIGTGIDGGALKKDFWEYDPLINAWTQKADFGGTARLYAVGFSISNKGYIGTGTDGTLKKDFWEYDPTNNTWLQKADFGGTARSGAVGFSIGNKGYIGTGYDGAPKKDFWEYDPSNNTWLQKADFGGVARQNATGFSIAGHGFIGGGTIDINGNSDYWKYNPATNEWTQIATSLGIEYAASFVIGDKAYIIGGKSPAGPESFALHMEYNSVTNSWSQIFPTNWYECTRRHRSVAFSIGNRGYVGTGQFTGLYGNSVLKKDFWEFNPFAYKIASYNSLPPAISSAVISDGIWVKGPSQNISAPFNNFLIDNYGKVGINTLTPTSTLTVNGSASISNGLNCETLDIAPGSLSGYALRINGGWGDKISLSGSNPYPHGFSISGANDLQIHSEEGTNIIFGNNSSIFSEKMRIKSNGNVGIGTTTPNAALQFANTAANRKIVLYESVNNDHQFYGFGINGTTLRYQTSDAATDHVFYSGIDAATSKELIRIKGNGNVGIGTTTPVNRLSVSGNVDVSGNLGIGNANPQNGSLVVDNKIGATHALFGSNTTGVAIESSFPGIGFNTYYNNGRKAIANGYGGYVGVDPVNGGMQFLVTNNSYAANTNVTLNTGMTISSNGNTGIGVSDPAYRLDVGARMRIRAIPGYSAGLWLNNDANNASNAFIGMRSDNEVGFYGNTGGSNWRFWVNTTDGNAWLQGVLTQNSDATLKKNIHRLTNPLQLITQLSGYTYNWKDEQLDNTEQIGLLAQEIQKVYPQLVKENNGKLSVNYSGMVPVLLEAIKEQQQQIEELKKQNRQVLELLQSKK